MRGRALIDTSVLIFFDRLGQGDILTTCYEPVIITPIVRDEYQSVLPNKIIVKEPSDSHIQQSLQIVLGKGESSLIAMALTNHHP